MNVSSLHSASAASVSLPVVTGSDLPSAGSGFAGIKKRNVASTMETSEVKLTKVNDETKRFIPTDNACARMAGVAPGEAATLCRALLCQHGALLELLRYSVRGGGAVAQPPSCA